MYSSYSDYGTSSMPMQTTVAESPHELLSSYHHHYGSPSQQHHHHQHHHHHHEDPQGQQPTPPQPQPYYGAFGVSADQAPPEHYYLPPSTIDNPLGLLRADVSGGSYTHHRALAPLAPLTPTAAPMATLLHPTAAAPPSLSSPHYRRDMAMPLPRLTPSSHHHSRQSSLSLRRDPARKAKARRNNNSSNKNNNNNNNNDSSSRRNSFSPPPQTPPPQQQQQQATTGQQFCYGEGAMATEDGGPDSGEVTLDDKTPADSRRLWETRLKYLGKKGNGMWDDIMLDYLGKDFASENKKTQVKAALQMKIHRMLLKHGQWPAKDVRIGPRHLRISLHKKERERERETTELTWHFENQQEAALLRAYRRWEESRYIEILRLYEEEIAGERKGYEWKSQHVEAQLVKMGLEEPERDRDSKARKRKQVSARHSQSRGATSSSSAGAYRQSNHRQLLQQRSNNNAAAARLPGLFDGYHHYGAIPPSTAHQQQPPHVHHAPYDPRFEVASLVEQLGAQPPALSEEQQERLIDEVMERDGDETSGHNHPTHDDNSNNNSGDNDNNDNSISSHPNHPSILHITTAFDDEPHSNASSSSSSDNNNHHTRTTDDDDEMEAIAVRSLQQEPNYSHHPQGHSAHSHHRHNHSLSSDASRPRSAAARGVCGGEMLIDSPQHFGQGVGA